MAILSDEFYYQHINLDTVNTQVFTNLTSKVGDTNGRGLILTLTENGLQKDTTGISLNLKWKHRSVVSQGLDNFDVVDLSKGVYKITYPTEMNRSGLVDAFVQIVDSGKVVGTRNMIISVESTVGDDSAIESSNSFSALASALIEVQSWNDRIDVVEQEFIDKSNNLDATYPARLVSVEQQLADKVGGGNLATMADLGQDVKEAMTGGSVAVVGPGAVTMSTLANDVKSEVNKIVTKESIVTSPKNIFHPRDVTDGVAYLAGGTPIYNTRYKVTKKYPVTAGETISISGMERMGLSPFAMAHFWSGATGSTFVSKVDMPTFATTDYTTFVIPSGVTHFSVNINQGSIPNQLQIERSAKPSRYEPYTLLENGVTKAGIDGVIYKQSLKNLYDGKVAPKYRTINIGLQTTTSEHDTVSSFVRVEMGKNYTISGLDPLTQNRNVIGFSNPNSHLGGFVKRLIAYSGSEVTVYIDDPAIKYITFPVTSHGVGTYEQALNRAIQVEEGTVATPYEPYFYMDGVQRSSKATLLNVDGKLKASQPEILSDYVEINRVRTTQSEVGTIEKDISPLGISHGLTGNVAKESLSNNLFTQFKATKNETRQIFANVANFINGVVTPGKLKATPFTVPSGQFDNPDTLANWDTQYNPDDYCHPDIAYDAVGVAGYKYWMISSVLPALNAGDVVWEDEDLFVSNDGKTWLRIKSLYEDAKSYHASGLSLPPQNLAKANARKHAFLPCPAKGDTIEISVPADNGAVALDRLTITLGTDLPWKHDPAILIDGGYVYTYHSFHLPYADRTGGKNRFIVCVRTNDGVNWEVVRTDGSTMVLTEETSRQIFTKDDQGRYNYMYYAYSRSYSNPTIIKYGEGDFEMVYGLNYSFRVKGITPYNFDFSTQYPFQDVGSGNHPGLLLDGANLYLMNNTSMFVSTNRGQTFTLYNKYPAWIGGVAGMAYKKTMCKGLNGKVLLVEAQRQKSNAPSRPLVNAFSQTSDVNQLFIYEYTSVADMVSKAQTGLVDSYVDIQIAKVNLNAAKRSLRFYPYQTALNATSIVNRPLQRIKIADIEVEEGDTLFIYVTLNTRNGARIVFGGIDIV